RDQLYYLAQCGFDAFAIPDSLDADDALAGFADFSSGYQATATRVPWLDRRQPSTPTGDFGFPCA
ncbi:MAG TPA: DUF934 domain-containing protein, partial [Casimicrobiaceae bacterium]|nr:DUF934 domain-containing protein [Casimicrobiaceae bacterium]